MAKVKELYNKQDVFNALNAYIDLLKEERNATSETDVVNTRDIMQNVIVSLEEIVENFKG